MRRKLSELISWEAAKHLLYIPIIILKINNWYFFLLNYIGIKNQSLIYKFRNGVTIKTNEGVDTAGIAVSFIKKDYGNIEDNSVILDIGANIGAFSIFAAKMSKNSLIYAFEPMPQNYDLLVENIQVNNLEKNIFPFQLGIGAQKEKRKLFIGGGSLFHSLYPTKKNKKFISIDVITLQDIFVQNKITHCDLIKSDCEGAEFEIFSTLPDSYFKKIKEVRLEYHNQKNQDHNIKNLIKFFKNKGFELTYLKEELADNGMAWFKKA